MKCMFSDLILQPPPQAAHNRDTNSPHCESHPQFYNCKSFQFFKTVFNISSCCKHSPISPARYNLLFFKLQYQFSVLFSYLGIDDNLSAPAIDTVWWWQCLSEDTEKKTYKCEYLSRCPKKLKMWRYRLVRDQVLGEWWRPQDPNVSAEEAKLVHWHSSICCCVPIYHTPQTYNQVSDFLCCPGVFLLFMENHQVTVWP